MASASDVDGERYDHKQLSGPKISRRRGDHIRRSRLEQLFIILRRGEIHGIEPTAEDCDHHHDCTGTSTLVGNPGCNVSTSLHGRACVSEVVIGRRVGV